MIVVFITAIPRFCGSMLKVAFSRATVCSSVSGGDLGAAGGFGGDDGDRRLWRRFGLTFGVERVGRQAKDLAPLPRRHLLARQQKEDAARRAPAVAFFRHHAARRLDLQRALIDRLDRLHAQHRRHGAHQPDVRLLEFRRHHADARRIHRVCARVRLERGGFGDSGVFQRLQTRTQTP
jgi:hypothetical protein